MRMDTRSLGMLHHLSLCRLRCTHLLHASLCLTWMHHRSPRLSHHVYRTSPLQPEILILHERGSHAAFAGSASYDVMGQHLADTAKGVALTAYMPRIRIK